MDNYQHCTIEQLLTRNRLLQIQYEFSPNERELIAIAINDVCKEILKRRQVSSSGAITQ